MKIPLLTDSRGFTRDDFYNHQRGEFTRTLNHYIANFEDGRARVVDIVNQLFADRPYEERRALRATISGWAQGAWAPGTDKSRQIVELLDKFLGAGGALLRALSQVKSRQYALVSRELDEQFQIIADYKTNRPEVDRLNGEWGRDQSWKSVATVKLMRLLVCEVAGYYHLPTDGPHPGYSGLGKEAPRDLYFLLADGVIVSWNWWRIENGSGCFSRAMRSSLGSLVGLLRDDILAHYFTVHPPSAETLESLGYQGIPDSPSDQLDFLRTRAHKICEQVRGCIESHERNGETGFGRNPTANVRLMLEGLQRDTHVANMCMLLERVEASLPDRKKRPLEWAERVRFGCLVELLTAMALRGSSLSKLLKKQVSLRSTTTVNLTLPKQLFKNRKTTAAVGWRGNLEVASTFSERYINFGRAILLGHASNQCMHFFVTRARRPWSLECMRHSFAEQTSRLIGDVCPDGINLHAMRHLLATEIMLADPLHGKEIVSLTLVIGSSTVRTYDHSQEILAENTVTAATNKLLLERASRRREEPR